MTKKRPYAQRVPLIQCPHCGGRAIVRDSAKLDTLTRNMRCVCDDPDCGHVFLAQIGIYRTLRPSLAPNPAVKLPLGQWCSQPANDDERLPANDDLPPAAEAAPPPS